MARTLHHCPCFHQSQESLSLKNTGHVWLTRKGQVVIGNPEPDPHYLEYEMGMAWRELRYNGMPYEQDIWLE
ncbi:MAG TPA: hypothetical protein VN875_17520 [Candidatus Binatus sp.]|nr:hypothetical protein [Candidatus Binatus sp.]